MARSRGEGLVSWQGLEEKAWFHGKVWRRSPVSGPGFMARSRGKVQ